jgi:hypothetical protein
MNSRQSHFHFAANESNVAAQVIGHRPIAANTSRTGDVTQKPMTGS